MLDEDKKYCEKCGVLIPTGFMARLQKVKYFEFKDGIYCEKCAKIKVDYERKK